MVRTLILLIAGSSGPKLEYLNFFAILDTNQPSLPHPCALMLIYNSKIRWVFINLSIIVVPHTFPHNYW
jgi:hypothetical protein